MVPAKLALIAVEDFEFISSRVQEKSAFENSSPDAAHCQEMAKGLKLIPKKFIDAFFSHFPTG